MNTSFVNQSSKKVFHSQKQMNGKIYKKNVTLFCDRYSGFGMDWNVYKQVEADGKQGILFVVKNDLIDHYESRRKNRTVIAWEKGKYFASLETMQTKGKVDTLNERFGKQIFIAAHLCEKVE